MSVMDIGNLRASVELDDDHFVRKYQNVDQLLNKLESKPDTNLKIDADDTAARRAIKVVEEAGDELAKREFDPQIDADIDKAQTKISGLERELDVLRRMDVTPTVKANIGRAERALLSAESRLRALNGLRAEMEVRADTSAADRALDDVADEAAEAGERGGSNAGRNLVGGILAALASIPIAGAIVQIGDAIGGALLDGIQDGLSIEANRDLFSARTGLDEATSATFGRAAGEAYADAWGGSVEENLDAARAALQAGIIDADASQADVEQVVTSLAGLRDIMGEDIPRVATAAGVMIRTGMAGNAQQAFDVLVKGYQSGANASEDMLDTFTEYPALFARLGLDGATALGLLNQGLAGGARNSDLVADALKEFQIRATDASETSAAGFEAIGLSAEGMTAKIAAGGAGAKEGLDQVLDGLRAMEDPVARNVAGVALFGTQWEDLGAAILGLDVSTATAGLENLAGSAERALSTMGDNAAAQIESAQRNIETGVDGIKGALASAFSDEISGAAEWVQRNRGPMMEFLLDATNGAFDLGGSIVEGFAGGTRAVGDFLSGPAAELIVVLGDIAHGFDAALPGDQGGQDALDWAEDVASGLRGAGETLTETADGMEADWTSALDDMQAKVNEWAAPEIIAAHIHDAVLDAQSRLDELSATIDSTGGTVTINGNQVNAQTALDTIVGNIDEADGTVTINGNRVPAGQALNTLMGLVESSQGDITIGGDSTTAVGAVEGFKVWSSGQKAWVPVDADTGPASAAVSAWVARENERGRSIRIQTIIAAGGNTGAGFDEGGWTGNRPVKEPAGVVHGQEFVVRAGPAAAHRAQLEAMNAGRYVPGYEGGGYVTVEQRAVPQPAHTPQPAPSSTVVSLEGASVVVQIGARQFDGYIAEVADGRARQAITLAQQRPRR